MASRPHSFGRKIDFSHNMWDDSGFNERQNLNSPLEDHPPKRRRDPRESTSDPLESRSDPLDLDTTQLYLNVTDLQRSCKKLNKLRKELERKKKSKAQRETKQKAYLEDSKGFKQKKEAYRDLYNEILAERAAVESLFDTSGRPPDDNQSRRPIASERQKHKSQPHLTQMDTEECEKCHQNETKIWKLEADIDKYKKDILRLGAEIDHKRRDKQDNTRDLQQKIARLETQIVIERSEKEDALRRLSSISSNNNPNIPEVSDPSRPTKLSQQFSDLYDNEWADAFDELGNSLGDIEDKEIISYLLYVVLEIHSVCGELSSSKLKTIEEAFIKPSVPSDGTKVPSQIITTIKDGIKSMAPKLLEHVKKNVFDHLKAKFSEEPLASCLQSGNVKIYIDKCTEVCWNMSVHDPQMVMEESRSPDGNFDSNKHREYTQNGPYEEFVVWPVLYLYRRGPMLFKGVAQGTKDMKSSSLASKKLRNDNPTLADPCDPNRPTNLSEQFSELYENEWADAFAEIAEHLNGGDDKEIVSYLKDFVLEIHSVCSDISSSKLKSIEKSFVEPSFPSEETNVPYEIFKIIKDGIKSMAPKLLKSIKERVLERLEAKFSAESVAGCLQSINVKRYIDKCTEVCWYMSVQDPQMVMDGSESPDGKFDSNKHREYTRNGPYEEFVVWPVLYLYREGQILSKGVAQGAKKKTSGQQ